MTSETDRSPQLEPRRTHLLDIHLSDWAHIASRLAVGAMVCLALWLLFA